MENKKELLGRYCEYQNITCRINLVPNPPLSDHYSLIPEKAFDDIGNGRGMPKTLTPLEFDVDVNLIHKFYRFYEN